MAPPGLREQQQQQSQALSITIAQNENEEDGEEEEEEEGEKEEEEDEHGGITRVRNSWGKRGTGREGPHLGREGRHLGSEGRHDRVGPSSLEQKLQGISIDRGPWDRGGKQAGLHLACATVRCQAERLPLVTHLWE